MVLLTNKTTSSQNVPLTFASVPGTSWKLYGFDGSNPVHQIGTGAISSTSLTLNALPAMSANLLVITGADLIFADGFN